MAEHSNISWTDDTFNPWIGCTRVSPACDGCYAAALMGGEGGRFAARAEWGGPGKGEGTRSRTAPSNWAKPRKWNREQAALWTEYDRMVGPCSTEDPRPDREEPAPRFVFCASLADVFDNAVPMEWRRDLFELIRETPHLTWLLLTKRPGNIAKLFADTLPATADKRDEALRAAWPRNAAIGCTVVNQEEADRDVPKLLAAKAALKPAFAFLSMEPLLGPVALSGAAPDGESGWDWLTGVSWYLAPDDLGPHMVRQQGQRLDWVIAGGETDQGEHKARPADPAWYRDLRDQCAAAGVAYHHKQNGEWVPVSELPVSPTHEARLHLMDGGSVARVGKAHDPETLDGVLHRARPAVAHG